MRKIVISIILLLFGATAIGCGSKVDRLELKQAKIALKQGNMKAAINLTKKVNKRSPNMIMAKRFMAKLEEKIVESARSALEKEEYKTAAEQAETLLSELNPQNEEAKAIRADAKKRLLVKQAREASNPIFGLKLAKEALEFDPEFKEALDLVAEMDGAVQERISSLMATTRELLEQERYDELIKLTQTILSIEPKNEQATALLNEAQKRQLAHQEETNLSQAKKFFEEGMYLEAKKKAEDVLRANQQNMEARALVERSVAEIDRPKLRLTGFTKIKGMLFAQILTPDSPKPIRVREGEEFGDFKVVLIDYDLKSIVVKYLKTNSQQSLTLGEE